MKLQQYSDQELIKLYLNGDETVLEELLKRHKSKIYTSIYLLVKDQYLAEDIFQDAFIKVINTLRSGRYNEEGKFLPWVMRIAHNLVIDYFRREKRAPVITSADGTDVFNLLQFHEESAEDKMLREQTHFDLRTMIHLLPDDQKEVLIMRHYADLSFKEIADLTEVSINTALGRMRYALNNLRKMMKVKEIS
ncbi:MULTISPECIES: RNA polymerase sigma factor [Pedobacter]|uniref:RNA polymerase sigma factor, sigma-70 family n=1 Tax=Pedobacter heparinus (strain ATCC 13125 / DSM 2366 / CIP 104194 / JCM 7457 / NBRC 12017 / NCIMB 9290 / NRRL B-14731 / HIM 762-3) TaxID=485917 RepID=C6XTG7_PEDHD|nr:MULTISPECIES: sigma-70 family RNA polymerase sigma factor [Pedobacter]ACU05745.1 RNA polymerase sigma factor, sigma-70 family [Pedobacter heparinus DSM 2366]MBB5440003.1 RNA polymerase sigma-70 factor (ECF subfamily) [Pedobacter sp. AK017]